jgi:hypothetical protein
MLDENGDESRVRTGLSTPIVQIRSFYDPGRDDSSARRGRWMRLNGLGARRAAKSEEESAWRAGPCA